MISAHEIEFYTDAARGFVAAQGAIVDLGCWFGATSISLAAGIHSTPVASRGPQDKVIALDRFMWQTWMSAMPDASLTSHRYSEGDSFLPEARELIRKHGGGLVEPSYADLATYEWQRGPIKILLVDAMKTEELCRQIARTFYPHLLPGALVIHQDFKCFYPSWIPLLQYRLRDHFEPYKSVTGSGTVSFEVRSSIPLSAIERAVDFVDPSDDEVDAVFDYSFGLVEDPDYPSIASIHVMHYVHRRENHRAQELLERYRAAGFTGRGDFANPGFLDEIRHLGGASAPPS
jgi:hypothetical protein